MDLPQSLLLFFVILSYNQDRLRDAGSRATRARGCCRGIEDVMAKQAHQKLKIPYIQKMLMEQTDDEHGLTMPEIIEQLAERGIAAERKSVYSDLEALQEFGLDIVKRTGARTEYAIGARTFEFPELLLLVDAVQNSRFLTETKSAALVDRIKTLASVHQAELLGSRVHVEGCIKMQNESIYYNVDAIQRAISLKRKISFQYFEYDLDKTRKLRREGRPYTENPVCLLYRDDYYYLITYNDDHDDFTRYRVDRMLSIEVLDEASTRNPRIASFDVAEFSARSFGMFDGQAVSVELAVHRSVIGAVIDRFGKDIPMIPAGEDTVHVHVPILESGVFFGWLAQFGSLIRIEKPSSLADAYKEHLRAILSSYE